MGWHHLSYDQRDFSFIIVGNSNEAEIENCNSSLRIIRLNANNKLSFVHIECGLVQADKVFHYGPWLAADYS
jgi:hypothetical protein